MIPKNAERIIAARLKGQRPADMVLVALEAPPRVPNELVNPVVIAMPGIAYDWRWVRGLDVCVYMHNDDNWPDLVQDIALQRPDYLAVWNHADGWGARVYLVPTAATVDKARRLWRFELDFLPWMDFQNKDFIERRHYDEYADGIPSPFKNRRKNHATH